MQDHWTGIFTCNNEGTKIEFTEENLEKEHICCAILNNKHYQVSSKKKEQRELSFYLQIKKDHFLVILNI